MLDSPMWLVATTPDSTDTEHSHPHRKLLREQIAERDPVINERRIRIM